MGSKGRSSTLSKRRRKRRPPHPPQAASCQASQRRSTAVAASPSAGRAAPAGVAAGATATSSSSSTAPLDGSSAAWRTSLMTGLFEKPLAQGIYLHTRRGTRRACQPVKILRSSPETGWLMSLAAADCAYLQCSSSSVYRKVAFTAGASVQKCGHGLRSRTRPKRLSTGGRGVGGLVRVIKSLINSDIAHE